MMQLIYISLSLLIGAATAYYANQRGRDPLVWFMVGMLLGIFGLIFLFLLPPAREGEELNEEEAVSQSAIAPRAVTHDYLVKDWFYYDQDRNRQGPIRFEKLKELWKNKEINEQSFVWTEGMAGWQKLEEVHGLYTHLQLG